MASPIQNPIVKIVVKVKNINGYLTNDANPLEMCSTII